jgi:hypothetical protein
MSHKYNSLLIFGIFLSCQPHYFGQNSKNSENRSNDLNKALLASNSFDEYCEKNAIQLMEIPSFKMEKVKIAGTLNYIDPKLEPGLKAYGVTPAEKETTYYKLNGCGKLLAVKSIYVLKLNYANSKN